MSYVCPNHCIDCRKAISVDALRCKSCAGKLRDVSKIIATNHTRVGRLHPNWKDNIGNRELHRWVRRHLKQPELCQSCNSNKSFDLANVTGIYERDFHNWRYLCRRCHMLSDGRMEKFVQYNH